MDSDKVAHALGGVESTLTALVTSHSRLLEQQQQHGEKLAMIETKLEALPCKEHTEELGRVKWSIVRLALYLLGAGGVGGGVTAVVAKLFG